MKTCPTCHLSYGDDFDDCPRCGLDAGYAVAAIDPPGPEPEDEAEKPLEDGLSSSFIPGYVPAPEPEPELAPPPVADQAALSAQLDQMEAALTAQAAASDLSEATMAPAPEPVASAASPATPGDDQDITRERLAELAASNDMVIGLLGFPTAGKTWFLNRLKYNWVQSGQSVSPAMADPGTAVGATTNLSNHTFTTPGGKFHLIDLPGERFENGTPNNFVSEPLLLDSINACKAFIVILPADEALFSGRAARLYERTRTALGADNSALLAAIIEAEAALAACRSALSRARAKASKTPSDAASAAVSAAAARQKAAKVELDGLKRTLLENKGADLSANHQRLERFISGIGQIAGLLSLHATTADGRMAFTAKDVEDHISSTAFKPFAKPVCVALSKADSLLDETGLASRLTRDNETDVVWKTHFDKDPLATIKHFRPLMARQFETWFRWVKFDFLTAFSHHPGGLRIDYDLDSHGVNGIIAWMNWVARHGALSPRHQGLMERARRLRDLRDYQPQNATLGALARPLPKPITGIGGANG